jgi:hypothetical protein
MQCLTSVSGQNEENEVTSRNKIVVAVAEIFLVLFHKKVSSCLGIIIDVLPERHSIERHVCMYDTKISAEHSLVLHYYCRCRVFAICYPQYKIV